MKSKKVLAALLVTTMSIGLLAGCGNGGKKSDVSITFLNSKGEIQEALEGLADEYTKQTGVEVEILACGTGESPYTKVTSSYNSGNAPTMSMLDTTDAIALADEYALDLSNEGWVSEVKDAATYINGKIYSFPFCIEGRGLIVNKTAIEETLGESFDPESINSYDALKALLEKLRAKGMENPVVVSKEDWSLGNHQLGYIYDTYDGTTEGSAKIISEISNGTTDVAKYDRYVEFLDTLDLLLEYNVNKADPLGAIYDEDPIFLVDKKAAIWPNGTWAWPNLADAGAKTDDDYCFIPYVIGKDTNAVANKGMDACATKQVIIDKVQASEEQQKAARDFLDWMVNNETAQKMLVEKVAIVPANKNNKVEPLDPLGKDMKAKMNAGKVYTSAFVAPADHWSVLGASMQKYVAGESSKDQLAKEVNEYWANNK